MAVWVSKGSIIGRTVHVQYQIRFIGTRLTPLGNSGKFFPMSVLEGADARGKTKSTSGEVE
jgi:hypothetical protein